MTLQQRGDLHRMGMLKHLCLRLCFNLNMEVIFLVGS